MKKQMKRTVYEAPLTERFQVELEGAMMAGSIVDDSGNGAGVTSGDQGYDSFEGVGGFVQDSEGGINWE